MFLDNGASEVGEYLLDPDGSMVDATSFADLSSMSTRFRYQIKPEYQ